MIKTVRLLCFLGAAFAVCRRPMQHFAIGYYIVLVMPITPANPSYPLTLFAYVHTSSMRRLRTARTGEHWPRVEHVIPEHLNMPE